MFCYIIPVRLYSCACYILNSFIFPDLNESLVRFLMERDDLHMEQDSMLVDIEDLTRYL